MWASVVLVGAVVPGAAWAGGVACALQAKGFTVGQAASYRGGAVVLKAGEEVRIGPRTTVLRVDRLAPDGIRREQFVAGSPGTDFNRAQWLLVGSADRDVLALAEVLRAGSQTPKRVGGIGTCSLYTPCRKCENSAKEGRARQRSHPAILSVERLEPEAVRVSELVVAPKSKSGVAPWVLVFTSSEALVAAYDSIGFDGAGQRTIAEVPVP
jgi:hypothetical protein